MEVLLIRAPDRSDAELVTLTEALARALPADVEEVHGLQDALEVLGAPGATIDLVLFDYTGDDPVTVRALLDASPGVPCVVLATHASALQAAAGAQAQPRAVFAERGKTGRSLTDAVALLLERGLLQVPKTPDAHFVAVDPETLVRATPLRASAYLKLGKDHYVRLAHAGDTFTAADAQRYRSERPVELFYLHRDEAPRFLLRHAERLAEDDGKLAQDALAAKEASAETLEVVREITHRIGFSAEIQELARKAADLTLRAIGASPKLKEVVKLLKKSEGKYITSHSIMLAEVSCAVAYAAGWNTPGTFVKLSLAALLHDLKLRDNGLARVSDQYPDRISHLSKRQIREIRLHPIRAAEFARRLIGVPADVDRIILQHHERPDGSGYPRGLFHTHIDPLSTTFIVSHDLLDFFLQSRSSGAATLAEFLNLGKKRYAHGNFRKLITTLAESLEP
jgi:HD-GYP domain-containing protein (c-di-GMP phosphodiesterase class II)